MFEAMLSRIGDLQQSAGVKTVFGEPYQVGGRTIIPIAKVSYGFGVGGGRADGGEPDEPESAAGGGPRATSRRMARGAGGGGGAGVSVRPVAVLEVSAGETKVRPIVDVTRLVLAGMLLAAWNVFWITYTVRRKER